MCWTVVLLLVSSYATRAQQVAHSNIIQDLRRSFESWQKDFTSSLALVSAVHTNVPRSMGARTLQLDEARIATNEDASGEDADDVGSGEDGDGVGSGIEPEKSDSGQNAATVDNYLKRYLVKDKPRTQRDKLLAIYEAQVHQETRTLSPAARDYIVETHYRDLERLVQACDSRVEWGTAFPLIGVTYAVTTGLRGFLLSFTPGVGQELSNFLPNDRVDCIRGKLMQLAAVTSRGCATHLLNDKEYLC